MKRLILMIFGISIFLGTSCSEPNQTMNTATQRSSLISDETRGGHRGFLWVPPMAPATTSTNSAFLRDLNPEVQIVALGPNGAESSVVATYTRTSGPLGQRVYQPPAHEYYAVSWDTWSFTLTTTTTYRIRVSLDGEELGLADVDLAADRDELWHVQKNHFIPLLNGRTLSIRFRIEQESLACAAADCDDANPCTIDSCGPLDCIYHPAPDGLFAGSATTNCGVGACRASGRTECLAGAIVNTCAPLAPTSADTMCNGADDDCDGSVDEDYVAVSTSCGARACAATGTMNCAHGTLSDSCTPTSIVIPPVELGRVTINAAFGGNAVIRGGLESAPPSLRIDVTNDAGATVSAIAHADGAFSVIAPVGPGGRFTLRAVDEVCGESTTVELTAPPADDPGYDAPALPGGSVPGFRDSISFLFEGPGATQNTDPSTIDEARAAVLRGEVFARGGAPLAGVVISVRSHPELGSTVSRSDGKFDFVVNGGGILTVEYRMPGYVHVQRTVHIPWLDFVHVPEVVLTPFDPEVTAISLNAAEPQVAAGSVVEDEDGPRRAVVIFPAGTEAVMTLPSGATQALSSQAHFRATEFTVGPEGRAAMPGALPPSSAYNYAVELSFDEAVAAGADRVDFNTPLPFYVDNFLGFPVGEDVPIGYYDRARSVWVPSPDGRIIRMLAVDTSGLAQLDVDGTGVPASTAALTALGINNAERASLAALYAPNASFWRSTITHFTPFDCNWAFGLPPDAQAPRAIEVSDNGGGDGDCTVRGSIIQCQGQVLGESIPLKDIPAGLHYRSDRARARNTSRSFSIPLSGLASEHLIHVRIEISVAGNYEAHTIMGSDLGAGSTFNYEWDGLDAYGRYVQGARTATIRVCNYYQLIDMEPEAAASSFAAFGEYEIFGGRAAGYAAICEETKIKMGSWDSQGAGLGGWSLGMHHAFDAVGKTIYYGYGGQRKLPLHDQIIRTIAGSGLGGFAGDGGLGRQARLTRAADVAVDAAGNVYIADSGNHRIRVVSPDGVINTFAGSAQNGYAGDGGDALLARLSNPVDLAIGPDNYLYISDFGNSRIRRINLATRVISYVAGTGTLGSTGDFGPASAARIAATAIDVDAAGNIYISEASSRRIRKITPNGIIVPFAGTGQSGSSGDLGPALDARFGRPEDVAVAPDGSVYVADSEFDSVRRIDAQTGVIDTVAGTFVEGFSGNGGPADAAMLANPVDVAVDAQNNIFIADRTNNRVRHVQPNGEIRTLTGNGVFSRTGDGGPPAQASTGAPECVAFGPGGSLFIGHNLAGNNPFVREVSAVLDGLVPGDVEIASQDGTEVYHFDGDGRHLTTTNALTGEIAFSFGYSSADALTSVTDGDGMTISISRPDDTHAVITSPHGHQTSLLLDQDRYLISLQNPAAEAFSMTYWPGGLLRTFENPNGHGTEMFYNSDGRLIHHFDEQGHEQTLTRNTNPNGYTVQHTSPLGRVSTYETERLSGGVQHGRTSGPDQLVTETFVYSNGTRTLTTPDGTTMSVTEQPDSRFGASASYISALTIALPSGRTYSMTAGRANVLSGADPLALVSQTETRTVNGRAYSATFSRSTGALSGTTPEGRQLQMTLDGNGLPTSQKWATFGALEFERSLGLLESIEIGGDLPAPRRFELDYLGSGTDAGFLDTITDPQSAVIAFDRDLAGRPRSLTLGDGRERSYEFDGLGNLTGISPFGRPEHVFTYDDREYFHSYTTPGPSPTTETHIYNADRQLELAIDGEGRIIDPAYHATNGRLLNLAFDRGTISVDYEPTTGRIHTINAPGGNRLEYGYDGFLRTSEAWSGAVTGTVELGYDNNFWVDEISVDGDSINFVYDDDGMMTQAGDASIVRHPATGALDLTTVGNISTDFELDDFGAVETIVARFGNTAIYSASYAYNERGKITQMAETVGQSATTVTYGYNFYSGGLESAVASGGMNWTHGYVLDDNGNRISHGTYDTRDQVLTFGSSTFVHNGAGQIIRRTDTSTGEVTEYDYDALGNLVRVSQTGMADVEYEIDGANRRIAKIVGGVTTRRYLYQDALRMVAEQDSAGNLRSRFVYGGRSNVPEYFERDGQRFVVIADIRGSVRLVVESQTGAIMQRLDYDESGRVLLDTNPGFQPFGFGGGIYDSETGLVRFGARDYDAGLGRWMAREPLLFGAGDGNLFAFGGGDPVNTIDPDGRIPLPLALAIVGGVGGFVGSVLAQGMQQGWGCINYGDAAIAGLVGAAAGAVSPWAATTYLEAALLGSVSNQAQYLLTETANGRDWSSEGLASASITGLAGGVFGGKIKTGAPVTFSTSSFWYSEAGARSLNNQIALRSSRFGAGTFVRSTAVGLYTGVK